MAKNAVTDWDTTAANNTDVGGISIQGTAPVSNFDNATREIMAQIATFRTSLVTLTGTQTLTNKTLTSPAINTPTIATPAITGGTASSFTLTGSAFNGTVGATTPSTVAGTTGTFSGAISATSGTFSSNLTALQNFLSSTVNVVLAPSAAGNVLLRPNGTASTTGQLAIASTGAVTINGTLTVTG